MKILFLLTIASPFWSIAQTITNGNFNSTSTGWGCSPEATHFENVYGGSSTTNRVAEVDAAAGLCQTVSGFTIGSQYSLTFDCSRRTSCGPTLQSMSVTGSGGIISASVSRNGGGFLFIEETFTFIATSTSHTFTFAGTSAGTCGLIIDNVAINLVSPLPIELLSFEAQLNNHQQVDIAWTTVSEINNDYFTILRSKDGYEWMEHSYIAGAGNSASVLHYSTIDKFPFSGVSYYRLKQTDFDGTATFSDIRLINLNVTSDSDLPFPNPTEGKIELFVSPEAELRVFNALGQDVSNETVVTRNGEVASINLTNLPSGVYFLLTGKSTHKITLK